MNVFDSNNKLCGVHWLKQPIGDLIIKIQIKTREGVNTLPKIKDYQLKSDEENLEKLSNYNLTDYIFKWQEKVFSLSEIEKYSEEHNCISDTELHYYDLIKDQNYNKNKIFTYIHSDCHYAPLPFDNKKFDKTNIPKLNVCFEKLNLGKKIFGSDGDSSSLRHLFKSDENIHGDNEQWRTMQIALDRSEYDEDSKLIFKEEHILLRLHHNLYHNYLVVTPDVNDIHTNSYHVNGVLGFEYGVEIKYEGESGEDMKILLNNLLTKWNKKNKKLLSFATPPLGQKTFHLRFEIVSAAEFDMDNIYIEYHIKEPFRSIWSVCSHIPQMLPDLFCYGFCATLMMIAGLPLGTLGDSQSRWQRLVIYYVKIPDTLKHTGDLTGCTHCSKMLNTNKAWRYGHNLELELECATGIDPQAIKIYLEAISVDWWGRHRTEGYTYLALSLQPGCFTDRLSCSRPEERNSVVADSRRFFVGGCHLLTDLNVLDNPQLKEPDIRYTSTGTIFVRWHVISHSPSPSLLPSTPHSSSSALLKGAEAALKQYKKAKETLAIATGLALDESGDG